MKLAHFEKIDSTLQSLLRMGDFLECDHPRDWIKTSNRLLDECVEAGMNYNHNDHVQWALEKTISELLSA